MVEGLIFFNKFNAPQCVVAFLFNNNPAFASNNAPVQTEAIVDLSSKFLIHFKTLRFFNKPLVPIPPGIISISTQGKLLKE